MVQHLKMQHQLHSPVKELFFSSQTITITIDVNKESADEFHMLFRHRQNKRYGTYWLGYFTELFTSEEMPFKCEVEGQAFDESISLTLKIGYEK